MIENFESTPLKLSIIGGNIVTTDKYSGSQCYGKTINQNWQFNSGTRFFMFSGKFSEIKFWYKIDIKSMRMQIKMNGNLLLNDNSPHDWALFNQTVSPGDHTIEFWGMGDSSNYYYSATVLIDQVMLSNPKFLLQDGNNLCNSDGTDLSTKGNLPYTNELFTTYGMQDLSNINPSIISYINNKKYNIGLLK